MKLGVIIIFYNNEEDIDTAKLIKQFKQATAIHFCLVDNQSKDKTLQMLEEIRDTSSDNVSLVEVKKHVLQDAAKRAGARYIFNQSDLKHVSFISTENLLESEQKLADIIALLNKNTENIINYNAHNSVNFSRKSLRFKAIFSLTEYLEALKVEELLET